MVIDCFWSEDEVEFINSKHQEPLKSKLSISRYDIKVKWIALGAVEAFETYKSSFPEFQCL